MRIGIFSSLLEQSVESALSKQSARDSLKQILSKLPVKKFVGPKIKLHSTIII